MAYLQDKNFTMVPITEIYDMSEKKIQYVASVKASPAFFQGLLK